GVVEAHHGDVLGYAQPVLVQGVQGPDGDHVVRGEERIGQAGADQLGGELVSGARGPLAGPHQRPVEAGGLERGREAAASNQSVGPARCTSERAPVRWRCSTTIRAPSAWSMPTMSTLLSRDGWAETTTTGLEPATAETAGDIPSWAAITRIPSTPAPSSSAPTWRALSGVDAIEVSTTE